ncbi:3-oxoacyl-ACP reductase [Sodalis praecaptivus]|uniref:3-oxoacyl-ACP reductase n=1 Tax=Sodalis praecaptivus TaxID=1239307 RepID=W0HWQ9_9GAMM|nr:SDR family oxidoreductase [Sodalis praecaptivus]AHF76583.1 3-oxoacyl-ACP reductase [Sodalis praecaptivus]
MQALQGKTAVITGGNSGIGLAIARRFASEGAYVFITGRRQGELDNAVAAIGANVEAVAGDITEEANLARLFAAVQARRAGLDILVTNAGVAEYAPLEDITPQHFERTFGLNARATLFTVQGALPLMTRGGAIVLLGSIAGTTGTAGYTTYGASKAAIRAFARTWTRELAGRGIRVNTLSPGPIDTPMFEGASDALRESLVSQIPLGRMGQPEEVAAAALFLASDESRYIAGAELCIDGGLAQV